MGKETVTWSLKVNQELINCHLCIQIVDLENSSKLYYEHDWRNGSRSLNNMLTEKKNYIEIEKIQERNQTHIHTLKFWSNNFTKMKRKWIDLKK